MVQWINVEVNVHERFVWLFVRASPGSISVSILQWYLAWPGIELLFIGIVGSRELH